jgi:hypothetical protein
MSKQLAEAVDTMIGSIIASGETNVELVQGFTLLSMYSRASGGNVPRSERPWMLLGIALR